jgi:two-component system CitB family response regulator
MIKVVVVEDDFRVARVHAEVVGRVDGMEAVALAHTASAGLDAIGQHRPDLVMLDLYLPDAGGLELLRRTRALAASPGVIVISAANDAASVRRAMRYGVFRYLLKPLDLGVLRDHLTRYVELHARLAEDRELEQCEIDELLAAAAQPAADRPLEARLPKGHSPVTAGLVLGALAESDGPRSAAEVAERVGISRWTAQRYLTTLTERGLVQMQPQYGTAGRPEHRYSPVR